MQDEWQKNIENYLLKRNEIVSLIQFIDARHPVQQNDYQMSEWIRFNNLPYIVFATKIDCITRSKVNKTLNDISTSMKTQVYPFSKNDSYYNKNILEVLQSKINSFE